ncbi:MAG: JAB domain-containing protein [Bacillota bacterium]|nr:JAB domain-containing protein [Bacillota bacterium]
MYTQERLAFNSEAERHRPRPSPASFSWVSVKLVREKPAGYAPAVRTPQDAYEVVRSLGMEENDREVVVAILLGTKNQVNGVHVVSVGTLNSAPVHPREVFKAALLANAAALILVHNHPSGDPTPSRQDLELARQIREAGELLGVSLLDFLVIGFEEYVSLKEEGQLA